MKSTTETRKSMCAFDTNKQKLTGPCWTLLFPVGIFFKVLPKHDPGNR